MYYLITGFIACIWSRRTQISGFSVGGGRVILTARERSEPGIPERGCTSAPEFTARTGKGQLVYRQEQNEQVLVGIVTAFDLV